MESAATQQMTGENPNTGNAGPVPGTGLVLRRIIAERGRSLTSGGAEQRGFSLERAAAMALGRAAEKLHRLPIFVERVELAPITVPELSELLPERALLCVLEGSRDELGVMALCPNLLASIIEMQAIGRVTSRPAQSRRPTRTDATISADFVNALLAELGRELRQDADTPAFGAYRYATYIDDPRPLALMLEDGEMQRLSLNFRVGAGGQRDASILIALPAPESRDKHPIPLTSVSTTAQAKSAATPAPAAPTAAPLAQATLRDSVQSAPVRVVGVLCRRKLSLQALRALGPGSLIPLPQNVMDEARLETPNGQLLALGRLGEADGFHALRLKRASSGVKAGTAFAADAPMPSLADQPEFDPGIEPPLADLHHADAFRDIHGTGTMVQGKNNVA